jgi:hypothetical protein
MLEGHGHGRLGWLGWSPCTWRWMVVVVIVMVMMIHVEGELVVLR